MKKPKFKDRYVLGVGYPWIDKDRSVLSLCSNNHDGPKESHEKLISPGEFDDNRIPKYRLVLEKVK